MHLSSLLAEVKNKGFTDAFIVAFHGDERITIDRSKEADFRKNSERSSRE